MRTKEDILTEIKKDGWNKNGQLVEALLDIRDILVEQNKPKPQYHEFNISQTDN